MATMITSECINCGACEPECPNTAIYQGGVECDFNGVSHPPVADGIFYIVPEKCTECVGFYDHEACAAVCPVDCCIPNPDIVETEAVLIARAQQLHPETTFASEFPSRFRGDGAAAAPVQANGHAEPAPVTVAAPAPAAKPAAPAAAPAPKPAAALAKAAPTIKPAPAAKPAASAAKTEKVFPGELGLSFEAALARVQPRTGKAGLGALLSVAQPILGALPFSTKKALQEAVGDRRYFSAATATGLNVLLNMVLYPALLMVVYTTVMGGTVFSQGINKMIFLGLFLAATETMIRLREAFFYGVPSDEATFRGTFYGLPLAPLVSPFLGSAAKSRSVEKGQMAFEGYYTQEFDEKTERARRYGEVFTIEELGNAYLLRMELPRRVPVSAAKREMGVGDEMPDYDLDLSLRDGNLMVRGKLSDPQMRKLAAISPAFPPDFTKQIEFKRPVSNFKHRYRDKTLEVALFKR
ncbi:MAG: 4Fe-4S dicluster domain-containing protein [Deltaproteobacteria bacterium]|nr:4Fe-4S dicluster domain-containing protein [Deltaproteobacteria bacterium]